MAEYWGPFAKLRTMGVPLEETGFYEGFYATLYDLTTFGNEDDVEDYLRLASAHAGPILELGCGSGRVLLRLAERGSEVVGLDTSAEMLDILRTRLKALSPDVAGQVRLVHGDARRYDLPEKFNLIILPAFSISLFLTPESRAEMVERVAAHLTEGGTFAFDFLRYSEANRQALDGEVQSVEFPATAGRVASSYGVRFSPDLESVTWNFYTRVTGQDGGERHCLSASQLALIREEDLDELLASHGLSVAERHSAPLPMGGTSAERVFYRCTRKAALSYPLWHPYMPMNATEQAVTVLTEGRGSRVRDQNGKEYIDMSGGLWSTQCGLGHPEIIEAVAGQLRRLSYGTLFALRSNEPAIQLARTLREMAPAPLSRVYLTNSGSESVELAIKLSRLYFHVQGQPERNEILYLDQSYHGTFFGSMGVTGLFDRKERFGPLLPGLVGVQAPCPSNFPPGTTAGEIATVCASEVERYVARGTVAAIIMEPVLGSAGAVVLPQSYLSRVQEICRRSGVMLVLDEVATGFGRTGRWFAAEHFGLRPDMMLLSKGINSGYLPLGAVLFSEEIARVMLDHQMGIGHGSSHNGNPACCAAALAAINVMREERLPQRAAEMGQYFRERLQELRRYPFYGRVNGLGLMLGLECVHPEDAARPIPPERLGAIYLALKETGVLPYLYKTGLSFFPALTISEQEIDQVVAALHGVFGAATGR